MVPVYALSVVILMFPGPVNEPCVRVSIKTFPVAKPVELFDVRTCSLPNLKSPVSPRLRPP